MSTRPSAEDPDDAGAFDAPDAGRLVDPAPRSPDIAPPLYLEPIPPPILTGRASPRPEAEAVEADPYALASAAASSMEREGRSFDGDADTLGAVEYEEPQPVADPFHYGDRTHQLPAPSIADAAKTLPPRRVVSQGSGARIVLLGAGAALVLAAMVVGISLAVSGSGDDEVLRPVPSNLDTIATTRSKQRFSVPRAELVVPPGSSVDFHPTAEDGAVGSASRDGALVRVHSRPPGGEVRIDGRVAGYTPLELTIPFGAYNAEIHLEGHETVREALRLTAEQPEHTLEASLVPLARAVEVQISASDWDGARLWIDGEARGAVPSTLAVQPGLRTFLLERGDDRLEITREIPAGTGQPVPLHLAE